MNRSAFGSILPATLLLDDYCSSFAGHLRTAEWDVRTVHDLGLDRKGAQEIVDYALEHDMVLVARDETLYQLAYKKGARCVPIAWALVMGIGDYLVKEKNPNPEEPKYRSP